MVETSTQEAAISQQSWMGKVLLKSTEYNKCMWLLGFTV